MIISNDLLICHLQALICRSQALHKASLRARCRPVTDADVASCDFATDSLLSRDPLIVSHDSCTGYRILTISAACGVVSSYSSHSCSS